MWEKYVGGEKTRVHFVCIKQKMIIIIEQEGLTKEPTLPEKVGRWKYKWGDINICEVLGYMNSPQL